MNELQKGDLIRVTQAGVDHHFMPETILEQTFEVTESLNDSMGRRVVSGHDVKNCDFILYRIEVRFVELVDQPPSKPTCSCTNLLAGCVCGAMKAEMAARGLTKCHYSGLWVAS